MYKYCFFKKEIIPADEAVVSLSDLAVTRGYAVFDYLRTYNKKPFLIDRHINRFFASANGLKLNLNIAKGNLWDILHELIEVNKIETDIGIRMVLTGGPAEDSMTVKEPLLYIIVEPLQDYPEENFTTGVKLLLMEYLRPFPGIKTTHYLNIVKVWDEVKKQNAVDVLYYFDNKILEASRSNFFIVKNNTLITPAENILKGCTRSLVLELAQKSINIEERSVLLEELQDADEAFITGTTKKITPVININDQPISNGKVGPVTIRLQKLFNEYTQASP